MGRAVDLAPYQKSSVRSPLFQYFAHARAGWPYRTLVRSVMNCTAGRVLAGDVLVELVNPEGYLALYGRGLGIQSQV